MKRCMTSLIICKLFVNNNCRVISIILNVGEKIKESENY